MTAKTASTLTDVFASTLAALNSWELPEEGLSVHYRPHGIDGPEVELSWYGKAASQVHDGLVWYVNGRFARARIVHDGVLFTLTTKPDPEGDE